MQLKLYSIILVFVFISFASQPLSGNEIVWRSLGLRAGMDDNRGNEDFKQYEGFTTWQLPWSWQWKSGWSLNTYLEANAGVLRGASESAFVGSILILPGTLILDFACSTCPMVFSTKTTRA
ncbi:MAG: hypothetical protein WBM69_17265 [Desulfobacterales bacterium]